MSLHRGVLGMMVLALLAGCGGKAPREAGEAAHDAHGEAAAHDEHAEDAGRVTLTPAAIHAGDIAWAAAGPRAIAVTVAAPGEVRLDAERVVQVRPRYAGVVHALPRRLGDRVRAGDLMAVLQSNESLAEYEVRAPLAGTVVARDVAVGQAVDGGDVLATIADLGAVWVDFALAPRVAGQVRAGQRALVRAVGDSTLRAEGRVDFVGPLLEQDTRVSHGRVVLANRDGRWSPGRFVDVTVTVERARVAVAVPDQALVRMAEGPAVFVAEGGAFALRPVRPGRGDGAWTEIVEGLAAGDSVVTRNAYLLKAELTKGEASHDH
jgi:membrane fusion protein, heavy metal efflux system